MALKKLDNHITTIEDSYDLSVKHNPEACRDSGTPLRSKCVFLPWHCWINPTEESYDLDIKCKLKACERKRDRGTLSSTPQ